MNPPTGHNKPQITLNIINLVVVKITLYLSYTNISTGFDKATVNTNPPI